MTELEVSNQSILGQSNSLLWEPEIGYDKIPVSTQTAYINSKDVNSGVPDISHIDWGVEKITVHGRDE